MTKNITYPIEKSPFYRLSSKGFIADRLGTSLASLRKMSREEGFQLIPHKSRIVYQAAPDLKLVLKKFNKLLGRIESCEYLQSKRGRSYASNGRAHQGDFYVLSLDIQNFFPSISSEFVFRCFTRQFGMKPDVAQFLTKVVCYKDHLPQGSPASQALAFFCCKSAFDQINERCKELGIIYTQYVDDMTFSWVQPIPSWLPGYVASVLRPLGLKLKSSKTCFRKPGQNKEITGTQVTKRGLLKAQSRQHNLIKNHWVVISRERSTFKTKAERLLDKGYRKRILSLQGRIQAARQVEPTCYQNFYTNLAKERKMIMKAEQDLILALRQQGWPVRLIARETGYKLRHIQRVLKRQEGKSSPSSV